MHPTAMLDEIPSEKLVAELLLWQSRLNARRCPYCERPFDNPVAQLCVCRFARMYDYHGPYVLQPLRGYP